MTVTFNDHPGQEQPLTGQYPTGVIDWGNTGIWWLSAPWQKLSTKSLTFASWATSATFTLPTPRTFVSLLAYNGGPTTSTVTLSCPGQPTSRTSVGSGKVITIHTGWTGTCSSITISSSNGYSTNFDDLVLSN